MKFVEAPKSPIVELITTYATVETLVFGIVVIFFMKLYA